MNSKFQAKEKTTHGGSGRGQGRRFLDNSKPGQGEYATRHTITLPTSMAAFLQRLGGRNLSQGVRVVTEHYLENMREEIE